MIVRSSAYDFSVRDHLGIHDIYLTDIAMCKRVMNSSHGTPKLRVANGLISPCDKSSVLRSPYASQPTQR